MGIKNKFLSKQFVFCWFVMLMVISITNCTSSVEPQEQIKATTTIPTVTASVTGTATHQPTATVTSPSTAVYTLPSPTTISSPTKIPVSTSTPIPTLNNEQKETLAARERLLQELMQTNGNCQLPCWWGIELGQDMESVGLMFTDFGLTGWNVESSDLGDGGSMGYINSGYYDPENFFFYVRISLKFYAVDEKVQFINVMVTRPLRQYGEEAFVRDWQKYFLSAMLQKHSRPQHVYFAPLNIADPAPPDHALTLYYPDLGINLSYAFYGNQISDREAEVCLQLENVRGITLSLYNPELADVWGTYLVPPQSYSDPELAELFNQWTWEAQTGADLDTFYKTYQDSENLECILLSR